ncbi:hypothetical protein Dimus_013141, partial [Dionaea muscipula]
EIGDEFVGFFGQLLGTDAPAQGDLKADIIESGLVLMVELQLQLVDDFIEEDVRRALRDIHEDKAPGKDGNSSLFFMCA